MIKLTNKQFDRFIAVCNDTARKPSIRIINAAKRLDEEIMTNKHMGSNFNDFLEEEGIKEEVEERAEEKIRLVNRVFEQTLNDFYDFSQRSLSKKIKANIGMIFPDREAILKFAYQDDRDFAEHVDNHVRAIMEIIEGEK